MPNAHRVALALLASMLAGCHETAPPPPEIRPVRTFTMGPPAGGETEALTGQVRARHEVNLAFRIDGRLLERVAQLGDRLVPGQIVARLDPQTERNELQSAEAGLAKAIATLAQSRADFERQRRLVGDGWTSRAKYDAAQEAFLSALAQVKTAQAELATARDQLGFTELHASSAGAVIETGADAGDFVHAGTMVVQVARDGERDAVFDVPEALLRAAPPNPNVEIALNGDTSIRAIGHVREIAPQADSDTRTFRVKVAIDNPPPAMRLGATVTGRIVLPPPNGLALPAGALTEADGAPAVWVVAPTQHTVALRKVKVARYDVPDAVIASGLRPGDIVVTAGVQTLRPGETVRLLEAGS